MSETLAAGCLGLLIGLPSSDSEPYISVGWHGGWVTEPLAPGCLNGLASESESDSELTFEVCGMLLV